MTPKKLWLLVVLFTAFGFSETSAQTTAPTTTTATTTAPVRPKRTYKAKTTTVTPAGTATVTAPVTTTTAVKTKRTYTHKTVTAPSATAQTSTVKASKPAYTPTSAGTVNNHQIMVGPKGGKYYINKNGHKTYVK